LRNEGFSRAARDCGAGSTGATDWRFSRSWIEGTAAGTTVVCGDPALGSEIGPFVCLAAAICIDRSDLLGEDDSFRSPTAADNSDTKAMNAPRANDPEFPSLSSVPSYCTPNRLASAAAKLKSCLGLLACTGCRNCWECRLESPLGDLGVLLPRT
jgi:hypothetical protein